MSRDLLTMVEVLAHEKNVDQSVVLAALESALASAVKKAEFPGEDADIVYPGSAGLDWSWEPHE